jgi:hypothetical protein
MTAKPRAAISGSGRKDSCAAQRRNHAVCDIVVMVTMFDEVAGSRSHGLRPEDVSAQADRPGLRRDMLDEFARIGVDPRGERGEYHTVVTDSPRFPTPIRVRTGARLRRSDRRAIDVVVGNDPAELHQP